jgi:transposase
VIFQALFDATAAKLSIPADHPLRVIRQLVDAALAELSRAFAKLYARDGRPSIPPERLLRALLLQAFYTVRSELQLMEQLNYNLLFRWFVGISADDPVWDATVFCKNRDRLLNGDIARKFMTSVLNLPEVRQLLSGEHFSVDGTLIEAWASMKSFVPKDGSKPPPGKGQDGSGGRNVERDFHGEKRKNDTHSSTTDPTLGVRSNHPLDPASKGKHHPNDPQRRAAWWPTSDRNPGRLRIGEASRNEARFFTRLRVQGRSALNRCAGQAGRSITHLLPTLRRSAVGRPSPALQARRRYQCVGRPDEYCVGTR